MQWLLPSKKKKITSWHQVSSCKKNISERVSLDLCQSTSPVHSEFSPVIVDGRDGGSKRLLKIGDKTIGSPQPQLFKSS